MMRERNIILRVRRCMGDDTPYYTGTGDGLDPAGWSADRSEAKRWASVQAAYRWLRRHAPRLRPEHGVTDPLAFYSVRKGK